MLDPTRCAEIGKFYPMCTHNMRIIPKICCFKDKIGSTSSPPICTHNMRMQMKRKATVAQFARNKRNRVAQELEHAESHSSFPLNDLPDMVLAIIVRLVVSLFTISSSHSSSGFCSFVVISDVFAIRRVNVKLRDLASQYNPCFRILQQLDNSCIAPGTKKYSPFHPQPLFSI